jgi:DNA-binding LacI/PurR family transcriptional regulator
MDVLEALQREILQGKFAHGKRLPSEAELCRRFKVSRPTATRALHELQQMGLIARRAGSGSYLTSPHTAKPTKTCTLGLLVPGLGNTEILDPICTEIMRFAQSFGCTVLWGDATIRDLSGQDALLLCRQFKDRPVDGVFFAPIESIPEREVWNHRIAETFARAGIPMVLLDRDLSEFPARSEFDVIGIDNVAAAIALTEHLLNQERSRICFVARPHFPSTTDLRLLGCREALRRHGVRSRSRFAYIGDPSDIGFVQSMLDDSTPDAIVCSNDQTAALLIRTLSVLRREVPADIAVAGFDDVQYATLLTPSLTTIRQPCREIARSAVQVLLERISDPTLSARQVLHSHVLIVRQSTATQVGSCRGIE